MPGLFMRDGHVLRVMSHALDRRPSAPLPPSSVWQGPIAATGPHAAWAHLRATTEATAGRLFPAHWSAWPPIGVRPDQCLAPSSRIGQVPRSPVRLIDRRRNLILGRRNRRASDADPAGRGGVVTGRPKARSQPPKSLYHIAGQFQIDPPTRTRPPALPVPLNRPYRTRQVSILLRSLSGPEALVWQEVAMGAAGRLRATRCHPQPAAANQSRRIQCRRN